MFMPKPIPSFWIDRFKASGIHLGISLCIAVSAALVVFGVWYPYPYRELSGGRELFTLVVVVDVILGPLITLAVFNRAKTWPVLRRDLVVIGTIQTLALAYGLWSVSLARPVHMVFEGDRFRVVHAADVPPDLLPQVADGVDAMPWTGPTLLSVRDYKNNDEQLEGMLASVMGATRGMRPDFWQPYDNSVSKILGAAKPATLLKTRFPDKAVVVDRLLQAAGRTSENLVYLPVVGRNQFWTVFLDPITAQVVAYMPLDPF